ncbi:MAG: hypothetical protein HPY83_12735 [Anaerolineae bacterium]|nr:hypothetical protein [Anaerolineae bacterium]
MKREVPPGAALAGPPADQRSPTLADSPERVLGGSSADDDHRLSAVVFRQLQAQAEAVVMEQ